MGRKPSSRKKGVASTVAAFVVVVGVYLAQRFVGENAWWAAALLYVPQALFLVPPVLAALVCLRRKRPWLAYLNTGLALAVMPALMGLRWSSPAAEDGENLRVMSYNVQLGSQGLAGILEEVRERKPDVVCMQEAYSHRGLDVEGYLRKGLPRYTVVCRGDMLTATRLPVRSVEVWPLPGNLDRRPVLVTAVDFNGSLVTVANAHLIPGRVDQLLAKPEELARHVSLISKARPAQAHEIVGRVSAIKGPVIVAGDFNNQPNGLCYSLLCEQMTDAFAAKGRGFGYTMPASFPLMRVDYVWIAGGLETVRAVVSSKKSSDHRPLVVDVRLARRRP